MTSGLARMACLKRSMMSVRSRSSETKTIIAKLRPTALGETIETSPEVGRLLMKQSATNIRRYRFELGGHAPFIVFNDAPLADAVAGCIAAKFATLGQGLSCRQPDLCAA